MKKTNEGNYLENLEFDEKLNNTWMSFFIDKTRFTLLILIVILIAGFMGLKSLPLESNPEVNIGMAVVSTALPGASPESVEDLVTKKIEKQIAKVKGIDTITSSSINSVSIISVQFKSNVDSATALRDLKDKVDLAKTDLPTDAKDSVVKEVSMDDTPIWTFSVSGNYDGFKLYNYGKLIKEELEKNSLVSEVNVSGGYETEFGVYIDPKKLSQYGLSLSNINSSISNSNITIPIGEIDVGSYNHSISVDSRFYDIEKLKKVVVSKMGDTGIIYLKDISEVKEVPKKITTISRISVGGKPSEDSVTLGVVKKKGGSIVNLITQGQETIDSMIKNGLIPSDLNIKTIVDQSERIKLDLHHLVRDGIITVILVFITLFLIIGIKEASVAGLAAPLVFLVTFGVMSVFGQTLNFLSMFALILSLGLLVDDAIVIISAINQYKKPGKFTTREAAILVLRDYKKVLITTTLTVVFIFSSMLFMTGIIGKFIFSIPFVITVTLLSSLVIALTLNPALAVFFSGRDSKTDLSHHSYGNGLKGKIKKGLENGFLSLHAIENKYGKLIHYILEKKSRARILLLGTLGLFILALMLPITGLLKSDFFPKGDSDNLYINIETEAGTKLDVTNEIAKKIEPILLKEKEIDSFSLNVGGLASVGKASGGSTSSENYASFSINLIKEEYGRKETSMSIADRLRKDVLSITDAKVTVLELGSGPASGADFELSIAGEDFETLDKIAGDVKNKLKNVPGAINIETSRKPLPFEFDIVLDYDKLSLYDLSVPQVATFLKNTIDGTESSKIYKGTDEIIIKTRLNTDSVDSLDKIKDLTLKNSKGLDVTLRDVIKQDFKPSVFSISRKDQKRVVTVSATAANGYTSASLKQDFDKLNANYKLPVGYEFLTGGANEESAKSVQSLLTSMLFGLMCIVGTLVLLYDSYRQSVLVMVTIPLSLIGVFFGLTLFGQPLSFPGLIGLVALFGIVVRNGIILFDKINLNLSENVEFKEAIAEAGMSRLEPVLLTSICTVLGMIPLTLSNPTWTSLGLSIIFGLSVSTIFTLLVLPTLFYLVFRKKYKAL